MEDIIIMMITSLCDDMFIFVCVYECAYILNSCTKYIILLLVVGEDDSNSNSNSNSND